MLTIKKNFEFKRVLSKGKFVNSNNLAIYFFPNRLNLLRFGFAVGKKAGKAVERNRIKRIIRESARLTTISFNKGYDLVFVWKNKVFCQEDFFMEEKLLEKADKVILTFILSVLGIALGTSR